VPLVTLTFASPDAVNSQFLGLLPVLAGIVLTALLVLWLGSRKHPQPISVRGLLFAGVAIYSVMVWVAYSSTIGNFVALTVESDAVYLQYAGMGQERVRLPKSSIASVLFGIGKVTNPTTACYISFETKQQERYRSVSFQVSVDACKATRVAIATAIGKL